MTRGTDIPVCHIDQMHDPKLSKTRRHLPHWALSGSVYYITFHLATGGLTVAERRIVMEHVKSGHGRFYDLAAATVMPNHVHMILKPRDRVDLSRIMKEIKGVSARLLNQYRNTKGQVWQEESWDRILRNAGEYDEKLRYMYDNPVKEGLATSADAYDGWYCNPNST
jgi:putative transposase